MQKLAFLLLLFFLSIGCKKNENISLTEEITKATPKVIITNFSDEKLGELQWLNEPESYRIERGSLKVMTGRETDFFNNPEDGNKTANAPVLYQEISGDFVAKALVRPDFSSQWNAIALMVYIDEDQWIKFAFENSDATGKSIVTVVTKGLSDDANGVVLKDEEAIWLKLIRKENNYSMLWSLDDTEYKMARLTSLKEAEKVKIGVEFQSPVGDSATHQLDFFKVTAKTVSDMRKGE